MAMPRLSTFGTRVLPGLDCVFLFFYIGLVLHCVYFMLHSCRASPLFVVLLCMYAFLHALPQQRRQFFYMFSFSFITYSLVDLYCLNTEHWACAEWDENRWKGGSGREGGKCLGREVRKRKEVEGMGRG
ncbi:hypothetical protein TRVL_05148 [Trypanosoma vivax]|nr:hypothetical protein TRVL_05148 [Trypanosoma vivax]